MTKVTCQNIPLTDSIEEGEGSAVNSCVGIGAVDRLEQISNMADVDSGLTNGVRLFNDFDDGTVFQAFDGLKLGEVVQGDAVELEGETSSVTSLFAVH